MGAPSFRIAVMAVDANEDMAWFGAVERSGPECPPDEEIIAEAKRLASAAGMSQERIEELIWKVMPD
jgi:hypothetical protein